MPLEFVKASVRVFIFKKIHRFQFCRFTDFNPFGPVIVWKIDNFKKQKTKNHTVNGHISKTRPNLESKLRFSGDSFNFFQNSVIFCALYPIGTWQEPAPSTTPGAAASSSQGQRVQEKLHCKWCPRIITRLD